jgi:hypothetical protein
MQMVELVKTANKNLLNNDLTEEIYAPALSGKSEKVQEANVLKLQNAKTLSRILEANSDCV